MGNNFIHSLKVQGLIDEEVVSLFLKPGTNSSVMKFGGWDQSAIQAEPGLQIIRTVNVTTWALLMT